ncbi:MAG: hypothetical protein H0X40_15785 [Chthoniobacterales bacterium]|nr:hypothetical protein [Chthoniobacterales bacterium]
MSPLDDQIDWSLTTWEGSRRAALRDWMKLTLTEKWTAVEEMADFARATIESRRRLGLPYIDPYTGERVSRAGGIREEALAPELP